MRRDLRASWPQALLTLFGPLLLFLVVRWLIAEPYVIPSGSMIPTLHVHDHILVNKLAYGVHVPFSKKWVTQWASPQRGDIIVFRFPENPEVFYVKRVVAVGGDVISMQNGVLKINGEEQAIASQDVPSPGDLTDRDEEYQYFRENQHHIRYRDASRAVMDEVTVPQGQVFAMGDNRDESNDSRFWGFVPEENLIGRAWLIWLACDLTLPSAQFLCDPTTLRWDRVMGRPH